MSRFILLLTIGAAVLLSQARAADAALPGLRLGFTDQDVLGLARSTDVEDAMRNAASADADVWRIGVSWRRIAATKPPAGSSADPGWSGYDWRWLDRAVKAASASGLQPVPFVTSAPDWAEGPNRPPVGDDAPSGTWRPSHSALRAFATALARRYSGTYPDPAEPGADLPKIRAWQAWNEPNLSVEITPQWRRANGRWHAASPGIYRSLLNSFSRGIKRVDDSATVITAGTAPYGDLAAGGDRIPPVTFWRKLLCVHGRARLTARPCPKIRFDAYAHHPYPIGPPRRTARNPDDAVVPDVGKITRVVRAADTRRTILPRNPSRDLWATELSWESSPDPGGLSLSEHALYLEGALYVLWRQGVDVVTWFNLRDNAPRPSYAATYQSGIFARGARPADDSRKPAFTAFRFPFTTYRTSGVARLWGRAPRSGRVEVQALSGGRWLPIAKLYAGSNHVFTGRLRVGPNTRLRAVSETDVSIVWRVV